MNEMLKRDMA